MESSCWPSAWSEREDFCSGLALSQCGKPLGLIGLSGRSSDCRCRVGRRLRYESDTKNGIEATFEISR